MAKLSSWKKFVLLLWKNWVLQWNHKTQLFVELLLPALFSLLLILVRSLVEVEHVGVTRYHEQNITSLDLFNASMAEHKGSTMPNFCLHYSPYNPILDNVVKEAAENLNMTHVSSADAKQLENDVVSLNNFAGIQFDDSMRSIQELPTNFNFTLRFPSELRTSTSTLSLTWLTKWLFIIIGFPGPRNLKDNDGGIPAGYLREGFLPIQHALSMAYIRQKSNVQTLPEVAFQRFPFPPFISDPIIAGLGGLLAMILLLSFIYPCTCITKYVTYEKEKQLKEVMKIMGLNNWLHWVAWFIKSFTMLAISTVFIVILLKVKFFDDVAVLTYANGFVLFVFMLVYITVTICFCFMMATLFSRASTAAAVTGLIWFIIYIPYLFLLPKYDTLTLGDKLGWCLILNTAMSFGFKIITEFEATGEGIQWNNIFSPVNVDDNLSLGYVMIMMLLSSVVYILICLYMEQIFPGDFGIPRKWYFPFTRSFWCGTKYIGVDDLSTSEQRDPNSFEREPVGKPIGIQVRNLKKTFGKKMAVRGISANMYEDEITVLLGHNGAGKTTTISMLTGMFPPTSGTAIINGSDIRKNIDSARMSMGICPQHNVLFDDMSVANHLRFFSWLKGLKGKEVTDEVNKYLKMIQLENKATAPAKTLSGGMMRKLSLCCALTGNTKVVLCDEPSSGMDPAARRQLWDMLQAEKMGRTILLTTHFMDEADVLGDRIAIMCDGELKCFGTSFFLKKHYGSGYKLICVKKDNCEPANVTALLNNYVPGIQPKGNIGTELSYDLPDKYSDKFEEMLSELEKRSKELNLDGYGIGITSLEEVFMKVGADNTGYDADYEQKEINDRLGAGAGIHDGDNESMQSDAAFTGDGRALHGMKLSANQWRAMMLKKMLYTYRNKVILVLQNVVAPLFVVMTVLIARTRSGYLPQPSITIGLKQYPVGVTVLERMPSLGNNTVSDRIATHYEELANSFGSDYTFESTGSKTFSDYILELGESIQVRINSRYLAAASIGENKIVTWLNNLPLHTAPLTVNMAHNAIAREVIGNDVQIGVSNYPLPYSTQTVIQQINIGNNLGSQLASNICFCMCFITTIYILFIIKERESRAKLLQFVSGVRVLTFWFSQFIWDFATYAVTALLIVLAILCFQEPNFKEFDELGRYYLVLLLFGCSALPFTYILAHWFKEPATGFSRVVILKIFAGMAMFIVVLFTSAEIFNAKKESDIIASVFRLFPHFSVAMGLNKVAVNQALRSACKKVSGLPPILICELLPSCCGIPDYFEWEYPGILPEIVYLVVTAIVYFAIIIFCEYGFHNKPLEWISGKPKPVPPIDNIDDDVQHERQRILDMSQREIAIKNLVLDRVCKYYGNFLAVNQVSLCVEKSECFGLLGVNGAGKTSLFKMMTGDQQISMGDAYLQGMNLKDGMNRVYQKIGYCPQFDALLDDLTGREMLKIFCLLRGIQSSRVKQVSEELAILFGFIRHIDKMTKAFSGGNKRKLNAAIAVLGSPSVIYLDEPTTGMDPAARRHLWNVVCRIRDSGKSIVLTSHSMEECEALCTRLAIMVNGELKCIGSTQHLKNKFSKGIVLKIKLQRNLDPHNSARYSVGKQWLPEPDNSIESIASTPVGYDSSSATTPVPYQNTSRTILRRSVGSLRDPQSSDENMTFAENNEIDAQVSVPLCKEDIDRVKEFVFLKFPQSVLQEEYQGMLTFYIPLDGIKWSKMFGIMERNRNDLNIEDYSISQTTLEEIFLEFAKHQREDKRIVK